MLSIEELLRRLKDPVELRAGAAGLNRMITWAHAVDTSDPWLWIEPGDLMMTTGSNLPSDDSGQVDWIQRLNRARVGGILLELPHEGLELTPGLLENADTCGLPLITAKRPILFNKISHLVVESALQSRWERTEMIQRLFSSYTSHLRRGVSQDERLQGLCRILDAEVIIKHGPSNAVIFHHMAETVTQNTTAWTKIELPGTGREVAYLKPYSAGLITDEEFMWHWSTLVTMELGFEQVQLDQTRAHQEPIFRHLLEGQLDSVSLSPILEQRGIVGEIQLMALRVVDDNTKRDIISRIHLIPGLRNEPHLITEIDETLFIALPYPVDDALLARLGAGRHVTIGLSRLISPANQFPEAADQAVNALQYAQSRAMGTAHFDDFVAYHLGVFDRKTAQQRIAEALGPILEHDKENSTNLLHTLRTYLEADRSGTETAKVLMIHRQTLIYRLKMIQRLTDIDPNSTAGIVSFYQALSAFEQLQPRNKTI
ncbi:MAG TPA: PucR family transcriptional regulator ligand-binding domain-containing protein [Enteractinococcus helveticum]|uniref:PucR family transcriptional regulator ligand-binding domain-containing protein n=1 Tax=Enteractinococcus helveticum TaxID=1837282 RepID=A0A921FMJ4_9MICC|nr:PucR family transcriptional regulator [Enteractinococcus helveticum]HJF13697.1 PucR family transcriptional regulator ligand-binding domain-containing protein [Enteractinococcus helveticum]